MNTSGFYKNNNGILLFGPNFVVSSTFSLAREKKNDYQYPVEGWFWFETEDAARSFFNLPFSDDLPKLPLFNPGVLTEKF